MMTLEVWTTVGPMLVGWAVPLAWMQAAVQCRLGGVMLTLVSGV